MNLTLKTGEFAGGASAFHPSETRSAECMAFAQLTYRESLRDIEACLRSLDSKLYHLGVRGHVSRSTLADANEWRDWRIHADFAQVLIRTARHLYRDESFGVDLDETVYALDATIIDLCLSLCPWARYHRRLDDGRIGDPLPGPAAADPLWGSRAREETGVSDEQLCLAGAHDCAALQSTVARVTGHLWVRG